ncbi:MAG: hypothetical protein Q7S66_01685 [bacterium]|nr:hypothetical protein [bacterium]
MSENFVRHVITFIAVIICLLVFYAGYISGQHGWWWTVLGMFVIYGGVYGMIK